MCWWGFGKGLWTCSSRSPADPEKQISESILFCLAYFKGKLSSVLLQYLLKDHQMGKRTQQILFNKLIAQNKAKSFKH